jgi:hypothetical protein
VGSTAIKHNLCAALASMISAEKVEVRPGSIGVCDVFEKARYQESWNPF